MRRDTKQRKDMKVVSFFSAKGGTCKTTMNMLFASFLKYYLGKRVVIFDFDFPEFNLSGTRLRELMYCEENGITVDKDGLYPIHEVMDSSPAALRDLVRLLGELKPHFDYLIMDFPGSFQPEDVVCKFVRAGLIDLMLIPVEIDGMIVASARSLADTLQRQGQETLLFFNKVHGKENPQLYEDLNGWFRGKGLRMSENRVKNSLKMKRDADSRINYLRSTIGFPAKDVLEFNPGIVGLFKEAMDDVVEKEKTEETA